MDKILVEIEKNGKITIKYLGFQGDACYIEAKRLYEKLREQGLDVEIKQIIPTTQAVRQYERV
jgi:menaquinone-dependent protoporphyrinogen IX oxidase